MFLVIFPFHSFDKVDSFVRSIRDAPRRQHGLTKPYYPSSIENGFSNSSKKHPVENGVNKLVNGSNEDRDSPSNSTVNVKTTASSRWVAPQFLHDITDRNELIFRRVRGILNKLTPEKFDKLSYDLINIGIDKTVLKGIIILIFEKAIDEQKYCNLYAQLCLRLRHEVPNFDDPTKKSNTFLRLLLSKCQEEFETRSKASSAFDKRDEELSPAEKHAKQVAKRKMLGNIKFIGELGKLELLHEAILHKCIQQLLAKKRRTSLSEMAEDIECMCQIMSTTGKRLDTDKAKNIMEQYFERIHMLSLSDELPSRIRFMLKDVIDLRYNKWMPRRIQMENGPRSVTQMRWESMGPMIAPPFPFFPPGMPLPPGMQHPNMPIPPFPMGDASAMSGWFGGDAMLAGGITPPSMDSKLPADYHDEHKDIFGKPVNKVPTSTAAPQHKPSPSIPKAPNKPDLFEPHYMKSKSASSTTKSSNANPSDPSSFSKKVLGGSNGGGGFRQQQNSSDDEKEKPKTINKNNPWNIDPFAPHFTKPSIGVIKQAEEANNKLEQQQSRTPAPPPTSNRYSPPQVPRNSAANSFNSNNNSSNKQQRQQQQQQGWKKNNGEVSLRPASFLSKKEEKPKTTMKRPEELSSKMPQYTNLTINDKTNSKSKKTALSKADIDKKIFEVVGKYKVDQNVTNVCNELQTLATNLKYSKMVAKQLLTFSSGKSEEEWGQLENLLLECVNKEVFSSDTLVNGFTLLLDDVKVMESTNGKQFMATTSAMLVVQNFFNLRNLLEHFQDSRHYPTVLYVLSKLTEMKDKEWLSDALNDTKLDLKTIFPKDERSDDQIMKVVREMNMTFLFPHLCIKEELLELMKNGKDQALLIQWVKEKSKDTISKKLLIHVIVTCAITIATTETFRDNGDLTQKPDKTLQEKEKEILLKMNDFLKTFVGSEVDDQLEAVYALQVFCYEKQFPKEMLLRLFLCFYNMEIIEEEVFLKWKEDLNDSYPGKGKSLFQVNNWLQWLETADVEEEEEDEEED